jgi:NAD(P)-dependent dehydrogenase (short-subunit alcohol dehydrogenase family)
VDLGLAAKVAVISGASRGTGWAIASELAAEGCRLALCSRSAEDLTARARELRSRWSCEVLTIRADITVAADIAGFADSVADRFGVAHVLVNNAGRAFPGRFDQVTDQDLIDDYAVKALSHVRMTRAFLPLLRASGEGCIVNINSIHGHHADPASFASSVNRAASEAASRTLALQLVSEGIRVNSVNIGLAETSQWHSIHQRTSPDQPWQEFVRQRAAAAVPMQRMARPQEVSAVVAFLASARASYLTGIGIDVGGGMGVS